MAYEYIKASILDIRFKPWSCHLMADIADIVVVGGGVHGASTAWHLAKRNAGKIVLIEKDAIASGASGWSSAIVRMHYQLESLVKVTMYGREMYGDWENIVGVGESGFRKVGFLVLFPEDEIEHGHSVIKMQQRLGIDARYISRDEISQIEPRLSIEDVQRMSVLPPPDLCELQHQENVLRLQKNSQRSSRPRILNLAPTPPLQHPQSIIGARFD
jgi:glycine/D-amino acid oxidase-like deaminating enzyme